MGEEINQVINNLSDKLGVAAKELYPTLIKQSYIDGLKYITYIFFTLIIISFIVKIIQTNKIVDEDSSWKAIHKKDKIDACIILNILLWIIVILLLFCAINCIANPEYYALKQILKMLPTK